MKIELKCSCGATAVFTDDRGVYIKNRGEADNSGRKFLIEVRSDDWQTRHQNCLISNHNSQADKNVRFPEEAE